MNARLTHSLLSADGRIDVVRSANWRAVGGWIRNELAPALRGGWLATLDLVFPRVCLLCHEPLSDSEAKAVKFCASCADDLAPFGERICLRCGSPLAPLALESSACAACRHRRYAFESTVAYGLYKGPLRDAVLRSKRAAHEPLACALGERLSKICAKRWPSEWIDAVVPMPMHWRRRWRRGTNSAELLAESVARRLNVPLRHSLAIRRVTAKQGMLTPHERFENVRGAFRPSMLGGPLRGLRILLVDDVMTTGATASEAARVLRRAGAAAVHVAVVARGIGRIG